MKTIPKWLTQGVALSIILAALAFAWNSDSKQSVNEVRIGTNEKNIDENKESIEYLQKTQNATHETVTGIEFELRDRPTKEEVRNIFDKELDEAVNKIIYHINQGVPIAETNSDVTINDPSY